MKILDLINEDMNRRDFLGAMTAGAAGAAMAGIKDPTKPYDDFSKPKVFRDMYVNLENQINPESNIIIYQKKIYNPMPYEVFMNFKGSKELSSQYIRKVPANTIPGVSEPLMLCTIKGAKNIPYSFYVTPTMLYKFKQQRDVSSLLDRNPSNATILSKQETNPIVKNAPKGVDQSISKPFNPIKPKTPYTY